MSRCPAALCLAAVLLLCSRAVHAAEPFGRIAVASGLTDRQVIQRSADGKASFRIAGTAMPAADGMMLESRILRRAQIVEGFDWKRAAIQPDGHWSIDVAGLPTGGPFDLELRLKDASGAELDRRRICDFLVGDLWITAGQSNMDGCGDLADAEPPQEMVHDFSLADQWQVAEDPLHWCYESAYPVYLTGYISRTERSKLTLQPRGPWPGWKPPGNLGANLGIPFGRQVYQATGVPVGLIICSLGGTTMDQWSPDLKSKGAESLYGAMLLRAGKCGGKVRGVIWYQGESDSSSGGSVDYKDRLIRLAEAIRSDLHDPQIAFLTVQIGRQIVGPGEPSPAEKNAVREAQRLAMLELPGGGMVSAIDLGMSSGAHLDTDGYKRIGRRLGKLAAAKVYGRPEWKAGPAISSAVVEGPGRDSVRLTFDQVNGKLCAPGRISGFSLRSRSGDKVLATYTEARFDPEHPDQIVLQVDAPVPAEATVWYGYGWDPFCNVTDDQDMPVPAFGPIPLK